MSEQEFICPQCHSENIKSFEIVYSQNVSSSNNIMTGVGITNNGGIGGAVTNLKGTSVTALGESVAPPSMATRSKKKVCLLFFFGIGSILVISSVLPTVIQLLFVICAIMGLIYYERQFRKKIKRWNNEVWPLLYDEWNHSYICMKCGYRFTKY